MFGLRALFLAGFAALAAGWCGCTTEPVVFAEALQMRQGDKVYTKYNLWYTDPSDISCLNIQEGTFIPVGTEIIPVSTSSSIFADRVNFKDTSGKEYSIRFDVGHRLVPMRDFVAYTFTTSNRETPPTSTAAMTPESWKPLSPPDSGRSGQDICSGPTAPPDSASGPSIPTLSGRCRY